MGVVRGEGSVHEDNPRKEGKGLAWGGNNHSAGGSSEARVKHLRTSVSFGLSSGSFARHRSTISQVG